MTDRRLDVRMPSRHGVAFILGAGILGAGFALPFLLVGYPFGSA